MNKLTNHQLNPDLIRKIDLVFTMLHFNIKAPQQLIKLSGCNCKQTRRYPHRYLVRNPRRGTYLLLFGNLGTEQKLDLGRGGARVCLL